MAGALEGILEDQADGRFVIQIENGRHGGGGSGERRATRPCTATRYSLAARRGCREAGRRGDRTSRSSSPVGTRAIRSQSRLPPDSTRAASLPIPDEGSA